MASSPEAFVLACVRVCVCACVCVTLYSFSLKSHSSQTTTVKHEAKVTEFY